MVELHDATPDVRSVPWNVGLAGCQSHVTATDGPVYQRSHVSLIPGAVAQLAVTDCALTADGATRNSTERSPTMTEVLARYRDSSPCRVRGACESVTYPLSACVGAIWSCDHPFA